MQYFFLLGSNPALSATEILSQIRLDKQIDEKCIQLVSANQDNFLLYSTNEQINVYDYIKRLGGTIKIGYIKEIITDCSCLQESATQKILKKAYSAAKQGQSDEDNNLHKENKKVAKQNHNYRKALEKMLN